MFGEFCLCSCRLKYALHSYVDQTSGLLQEVKTLRSEIKKMGTEGMKLLEQREREILEMRSHLKNVLKVIEFKPKVHT